MFQYSGVPETAMRRFYERMIMAAIAKGSSISDSGVTLPAFGRTVLLLCSAAVFLLPSSADQSEFISIDCGSSTNYTDEIGLLWTTDDGYINTGTNRPVTVQGNSNKTQQLATARSFREKRTKHCYLLPVKSNSSYLIRAYFHVGDLEASLPYDFFFNLSIDSTIVGGVDRTVDRTEDAHVEYLIASGVSSKEIAFCIIPGIGNPFISSLELRPLAPTMYKAVMFNSKYIQMLARIDCGAPSTDLDVRFPDDKYDRKWVPGGRNFRLPANRTDSTIDVTGVQGVPMKVMQSAWEASSFWIYFPTVAAELFYCAMFFAEIGGSNSVNRTQSIMLNDDESDAATITVEAKASVFDNAGSISGGANFSFYATANSTLPAILNALEFHTVHNINTTVTSDPNVLALSDLRKSLNLSDWTGDPCHPIAWDWVNCSTDGPSEVTQLLLSGYQISGTIPGSISDLTALTDLWLDNNNISGSIPDLAAMKNLRTLHLQNNSLTGPIPNSLADIPDLSELFLENNQLTGPVPDALFSKIGLDLRVNSSSAPSESQGGGGSNGAVIYRIVGGALAAIVLAMICFCFFWRRRKNKAQTQPHTDKSHSGRGSGIDLSGRSPLVGRRSGTDPSGGSPLVGRRRVIDPSGKSPAVAAGVQPNTTPKFTRVVVEDATSKFRDKIGEGAFGPVYKGILSNGNKVAVKRSSATAGQGMRAFATEVDLLSRVHHKNLVSLVGFCDEGVEQILLYEFMEEGTLREHLYGPDMRSHLDWHTRLDIALNAARGLEYLHNGCFPNIIHRDVKSNNILLSQKFLAKVADFGISRQKEEQVTTTRAPTEPTQVQGTFGYLDPEYMETQELTYKIDVYAFGVIILEIISGRAPNNRRLPNTLQHNLVEYNSFTSQEGEHTIKNPRLVLFLIGALIVNRLLRREGCCKMELEAIIDPTPRGRYNVEAMWKLAELAMYCVEPQSKNRPNMKEVLTKLESLVDSGALTHGCPFSSRDVENDDATNTSLPSYPSTQSAESTNLSTRVFPGSEPGDSRAFQSSTRSGNSDS